MQRHDRQESDQAGKKTDKQDDLKFRMLELRMDKEKLHMMIEQNHMNEIRFSRMLSQLNRQIHHEKLLLKSHQTSAGIQEETLLHNALTEYLVAKDITSDNPAQMISLWVTNVSLQRMRRKISRDKIQEFSTSMKVDALFRKRDHVLHREELRRREESDEKYQMELIRRQIVSLKARAEGIEKKNKILMTKNGESLRAYTSSSTCGTTESCPLCSPFFPGQAQDQGIAMACKRKNH